MLGFPGDILWLWQQELLIFVLIPFICYRHLNPENEFHLNPIEKQQS